MRLVSQLRTSSRIRVMTHYYVRLKTDQGTFYWTKAGGFTDRKKQIKKCRLPNAEKAEKKMEELRGRWPTSLLKPDFSVVTNADFR